MQPTPPPLDDPDDLPPMTYREASWHAHVAAVNAAPSAEAQTAPAAALATAAMGPSTQFGIAFEPISGGALLAIQSVHRLAVDAAVPVEGADELAVMTFCLARSERAFELTESGQLRDLITESRRLLAKVPLEDLPALSEHCMGLIARATGQKKTA